VAGGRSTLDPDAAQLVMERLLERMDGVDPLTALSDQERRVLAMVAEGLTNRQIAGRLSIAEEAAKDLVSSVLTKLGVQQRAQATAYGARLTGSQAR
jgi:DNA-binding NarL/FixJ family response regulator